MLTFFGLLLLIVFIIFIINKNVTIKNRLNILRYKVIKLGTLNTKELTILEWKPLFSIKLFYFEKGEAQEIYHTHSFSAISILLYGNYIENMICIDDSYITQNLTINTNIESLELKRNRSTIIKIPKSRFHQITKSEGCLTLMISGPWGDTYKEYNPKTNELTVSTHGRKQISINKIKYLNL